MAKTTNGNGHSSNGRAKAGHNSRRSPAHVSIKGLRYYPTYGGYSWRDKDPVIDRVAKIIEDEGISLGKLATISRMSKSTYHNWFEGETLRPKFSSIAATIGALGHVIDFVKERKVNYDKEYARAAAEIAAAKEKAERAERRKSG